MLFISNTKIGGMLEMLVSRAPKLGLDTAYEHLLDCTTQAAHASASSDWELTARLGTTGLSEG